MSIALLDTVVTALIPPVGVALLAFVLLVVGGRAARALAAICVAVLLVLAMPAATGPLLASLAPGPVAISGPPQAIVILSADAVPGPAPGRLEPGLLSLDRLRAGAALARQTELPVLVAGGPVSGSSDTLADMMKRSLEDDFRIPVRWTEDRSRDTWQNAAFSADILRRDGVTRAYLVTDDWHMRRALIAFRDAGLEVLPAPVRPASRFKVQWINFMPRAKEWYSAYLALHEWIGVLYYSLRG